MALQTINVLPQCDPVADSIDWSLSLAGTQAGDLLIFACSGSSSLGAVSNISGTIVSTPVLKNSITGARMKINVYTMLIAAGDAGKQIVVTFTGSGRHAGVASIYRGIGNPVTSISTMSTTSDADGGNSDTLNFPFGEYNWDIQFYFEWLKANASVAVTMEPAAEYSSAGNIYSLQTVETPSIWSRITKTRRGPGGSKQVVWDMTGNISGNTTLPLGQERVFVSLMALDKVDTPPAGGGTVATGSNQDLEYASLAGTGSIQDKRAANWLGNMPINAFGYSYLAEYIGSMPGTPSAQDAELNQWKYQFPAAGNISIADGRRLAYTPEGG